MARIYVASSWRNTFYDSVVHELRKANHSVYDFKKPSIGGSPFSWDLYYSQWERWTAAEYRQCLLRDHAVSHGFLADKRAMEWADTCVLVLPCGNSAHIEAGWFCGVGKQCIILTRDGEKPELMYLLANNICINMEEVLVALEKGR